MRLSLFCRVLTLLCVSFALIAGCPLFAEPDDSATDHDILTQDVPPEISPATQQILQNVEEACGLRSDSVPILDPNLVDFGGLGFFGDALGRDLGSLVSPEGGGETPDPTELESGEEIFKGVCIDCHSQYGSSDLSSFMASGSLLSLDSIIDSVEDKRMPDGQGVTLSPEQRDSLLTWLRQQ